MAVSKNSRIHTVDDARRLARRRLPRLVFDFIEGAESGLYFSDPANFVGVIGNAYTLYVNTRDGEEYASLTEPLWDVPSLESASISFFSMAFFGLRKSSSPMCGFLCVEG